MIQFHVIYGKNLQCCGNRYIGSLPLFMTPKALLSSLGWPLSPWFNHTKAQQSQVSPEESLMGPSSKSVAGSGSSSEAAQPPPNLDSRADRRCRVPKSFLLIFWNFHHTLETAHRLIQPQGMADLRTLEHPVLCLYTEKLRPSHFSKVTQQCGDKAEAPARVLGHCAKLQDREKGGKAATAQPPNTNRFQHTQGLGVLLLLFVCFNYEYSPMYQKVEVA